MLFEWTHTAGTKMPHPNCCDAPRLRQRPRLSHFKNKRSKLLDVWCRVVWHPVELVICVVLPECGTFDDTNPVLNHMFVACVSLDIRKAR